MKHLTRRRQLGTDTTWCGHKLDAQTTGDLEQCTCAECLRAAAAVASARQVAVARPIAPTWDELRARAKGDMLELELAAPSRATEYRNRCMIWSAARIRSCMGEVRVLDLEYADADLVCRATVAAMLDTLRGIT